MEGNGQFDDAEIRADVSSIARGDFDDLLANFFGKGGKLRWHQGLEIRRGLNSGKDGHSLLRGWRSRVRRPGNFLQGFDF